MTTNAYSPTTSRYGKRHEPTPLTTVLAGEYPECDKQALYAIDREVATVIDEAEEAIVRLTGIIERLRGETSLDVSYALGRMVDSAAGVEACVAKARAAAAKAATIADNISGTY